MTRPNATATAHDVLAASTLFRGLGPDALREVASEVEHFHLAGGATLMREGEPGDCMYVVASGRLGVAITDRTGNETPVAEIGRGETVGEMALLTGAPRSATVRGLRDSSLLRFSKASFDALVERHPKTTMELARIIVLRLEQSMHTRTAAHPAPATIAIAPGGIDSPFASIAQAIAEQLARHGATLHLSSLRLRERHPDAPTDDEALAVWLDAQEAAHRFVVYECDEGATSWTQRCLRQADRVVLAARAATHPGPSAVEERLLSGPRSVHQAKLELVLVHDAAAASPARTAKWLAGRQIAVHHHVRARLDADIQRLARRLAGRAIGLVLGGGGARGFAHLGVLRALEECGIPVDAIGGNSMGAIVGGLHACGFSHDERMRLCREGFERSAPDADYTLPFVALHAGKKGNRLLRDMFGDTSIEDLWPEFFCVATNLTRAETHIARSGPLWKWVRASCSAPGMAPPIVDEGHLMVDGGILDNLPVGAMRQTLGVGVTIASDAGSHPELYTHLRSLDAVSGWSVLWDRMTGNRRANEIPTLSDILMRTATISSIPRSAEASRDADLYLSPPSDGVRTVEWKGLERAAEAGYRYAVQRIQSWRDSGGAGPSLI